jgi:hypothetical protein
MKLPEYEQAVVSETKITEYLLSDTHPEGKEKAAFFVRFGFSADEWEVLADALCQHAARHEVTKVVESKYGQRFVIEGELQTPDERNPEIRSVWIIENDDDVPKLVTAYPL